ncbi:hypothetical protein Acsp05_07610 [Actinokineospora sp. NBRC 105648]|nr:hypothetical protein Acsp05_07610 [Actinokineospora sp. NBRC 105648]
MPNPVPSGSRLLCSDRLSGASNNQNAARTRRGAADKPNNRHIADLPGRRRPPRSSLARSRANRYPGG